MDDVIKLVEKAAGDDERYKQSNKYQVFHVSIDLIKMGGEFIGSIFLHMFYRMNEDEAYDFLLKLFAPFIVTEDYDEYDPLECILATYFDSIKVIKDSDFDSFSKDTGMSDTLIQAKLAAESIKFEEKYKELSDKIRKKS